MSIQKWVNEYGNQAKDITKLGHRSPLLAEHCDRERNFSKSPNFASDSRHLAIRDESQESPNQHDSRSNQDNSLHIRSFPFAADYEINANFLRRYLMIIADSDRGYSSQLQKENPQFSAVDFINPLGPLKNLGPVVITSTDYFPTSEYNSNIFDIGTMGQGKTTAQRGRGRGKKNIHNTETSLMPSTVEMGNKRKRQSAGQNPRNIISKGKKVLVSIDMDISDEERKSK